MSSLKEQVANFQVAPKYNICIGKDNAKLLLGLILDKVSHVIFDEINEDKWDIVTQKIEELKL